MTTNHDRSESRGIWVNPADKHDILVRLHEFDLQLIVMALDWAVEKSEAKSGAQTKPLKDLEKRMRALGHQRTTLVNLLNKIPELEDRVEELEADLL